MLNWIWLTFILSAVVVGGFTGKLPDMTTGAFESAEMAVMKIALPLMGIWAIWLGIMRLAERSGLVQILARLLRPAMRFLFPDVPSNHPAIGAMVMNMASNMLGLGNAATPLGLRAMEHLERLNPNPGVATNAMCTFLAINTASIQLVPTAAIGILAVAGSRDATAIVPTAFLASVCAAASGVLAAKFFQKLPIFAIQSEAKKSDATEDKPPAIKDAESSVEEIPPLGTLKKCVIALFFAAFGWMLLTISFPEIPSYLLNFRAGWQFGQIEPSWLTPLAERPAIIRFLSGLSILAVPFLLSFFPLYAALRKVPVYEQFVEGAKEAFGTAQRVIPYLVAMLLSISLLRTSGVIDTVSSALRPYLDAIHFPTDLLTMVLIRPLSGSATQGLFVELVNKLGPDTLTSRIAATIYGSTETTFYVLAVYFGSVAIRKTRHAIAAGLIADTVAVIASITICHLMFGGQ